MLLAEGLRGRAGPAAAAAAAAELARAAARALLAPLLGAACARLAACLRRAFEVAAEGPSAARGAPPSILRFCGPAAAVHRCPRARPQGSSSGSCCVLAPCGAAECRPRPPRARGAVPPRAVRCPHSVHRS